MVGAMKTLAYGRSCCEVGIFATLATPNERGWLANSSKQTSPVQARLTRLKNNSLSPMIGANAALWLFKLAR